MSITEPIFTLRGWQAAGAHVRPDRTYRATHVTITGDPFPRDVHTTHVVALPERETLAVAADMVRRALDVSAMSARQLLPIMRATAAMVSDPRDVTYRAAAMSLGLGSGEVDAVTSAFDPWQARQHSTRATRSRKGRTSFKRDRVSMAPVVGGTHAVPPTDATAASSDEACTARDRAVLQLMGARRLRLGTNGLDVQRATDQHYRPLGLPALVGSDVTSWMSTTNGDRTSRTAVASHRSGIDGTVSASTINDIAAPSAEYASNTSDALEWSPRLTLRKGRDRDRDATDTRVFVVDSQGVTISRWSLVAPYVDTDHRFIGHSLVERPKSVTASRVGKGKRVKSIDIGTVDAPNTISGWTELLGNLNRGEKITAKSSDGRVVVSRNTAHYNATDSRGDSRVSWKFRSIDALAAHLATA